MSCNIPDWFWQGYEQLLRWDVSSRLPGSGEEAPFLSQSDITRLLATASAMALEDDPDLRTVAYEVATRTAMMTGSDNPGQLGIAYVILSRLGNFPGRELLQERFPCAAQSISRNQLLNLERIARECENYRNLQGEAS